MVPLALQQTDKQDMLAVLREQVQSVQPRDPRLLGIVSLHSLSSSMMANPAFNRKSCDLQQSKCQSRGP